MLSPNLDPGATVTQKLYRVTIECEAYVMADDEADAIDLGEHHFNYIEHDAFAEPVETHKAFYAQEWAGEQPIARCASTDDSRTCHDIWQQEREAYVKRQYVDKHQLALL